MPARPTIAVIAALATGCGTTRTTDTTRAASEMMLVSQAIDNAVARLDLAELQGRPVFLDTQYLDGVVDKGYLISSLRQHLLAHGAILMEERKQATYVVEPRSGGVGTDKHSLLIGTPQMAIPAVVPGIPSQIPEIALVKRTDQKGIAKLAVFAYNRQTGRALWQSGLVEANSTLKDTWVFGAGPISRGSIRAHTELAGEELPTIARLPLPFPAFRGDPDAAAEHVTPAPPKAQAFAGSDRPVPPGALAGLTGPAVVVGVNAVAPVRPAAHADPAGVPAGSTAPAAAPPPTPGVSPH